MSSILNVIQNKNYYEFELQFQGIRLIYSENKVPGKYFIIYSNFCFCARKIILKKFL